METIDRILTAEFSGYGQTVPTRTSTQVGSTPTNNQDARETLISKPPVDQWGDLMTTSEDAETFNEYTNDSAPNLNGLEVTEIKSDWWKWILALICCVALLYWLNRK